MDVPSSSTNIRPIIESPPSYGRPPNNCPICLEPFKAALMTCCGHSFCYGCLQAQLSYSNACAICGKPVLRAEIVAVEGKPASDMDVTADNNSGKKREIPSFPTASLGEIRKKMKELRDMEAAITSAHQTVSRTLALEMLLAVRIKRQEQLNRLAADLEILDRDISVLRGVLSQSESLTMSKVPSTAPPPATSANQVPELEQMRELSSKHDADLQDAYFGTRLYAADDRERMAMFMGTFSRVTKPLTIRRRAILNHSDLFSTASIVSSIEFDRESRTFATAGVTRKIKIFDYKSILDSNVEVHVPIQELANRAKMSCLSWSPYIMNHLASADYEGSVALWDTSTSQIISMFDEHQKRAWCVDYCSTNPTMMASGSDDGNIKIWSTLGPRSISTIKVGANVCSVKFAPTVSTFLAAGAADHSLYIYDLRKDSEPVAVLKSHRKAISYVRFFSATGLITASTDGSLKRWALKCKDPFSFEPPIQASLIRTFTGHINEKNFVGLSVDSKQRMACGSENNQLYVYDSAVTKPIATYSFTSSCPITGDPTDDEPAQFVSAVCWKPDEQSILLAANSLGIVQVLEIS